MTHWIGNGKARVAAAAIGTMLALSACGHKAVAGSGGGGSAKGVTVGSESLTGIGKVLDDSNGFTLYHLTKEQDGQIQCTGSCVGVWPPLMANGATVPTSMGGLPGTFGTIARPDGGMQVTYNGEALYSFTQDQPGQVSGDGFKDAFGGQQFTWHVVTVGNSGGTSGGGGGGSTSSSGGGSVYSY